jgi:hypothetical protein
MGKIKFSSLVLMEKALNTAWAERERQIELYGHQRRPWGQWLAIWGEEIGETNQAIQPLLGIETTKETDANDFGTELIHAIAVGLAMYEQFLEEQEAQYKKPGYADLDD